MQTTQTYFNVLDRARFNIDIKENIYDFDLSELFEMGARVNPKRTFLFVNKLLGKHLDVNPQVPKIAGHLMANLIVKKQEEVFFSDISTIVKSIKNKDYGKELSEELNKTTSLGKEALVIGFAETATGLGYAVASAFNNCSYIHTTREVFLNMVSLFDFEEEHSHATSHMCYLKKASMIKTAKQVILVDDEVTTGKTSLNLIEEVNKKYPGKEYVVASLLDWRTEDHLKAYEKFQQEKGIAITCVSLVKGEIKNLEDQPIVKANNEPVVQKNTGEFQCIFKTLPRTIICQNEDSKTFENRVELTGRFGLAHKDMKDIESLSKSVADYISPFIRGDKVLCLGTEEFIYVPSRVATYLERHASYIAFKSTTRSPIYLSDEGSYPIYNNVTYVTKDGVNKYVYNIDAEKYDQVIVFVETKIDENAMVQLSNGIKQKGIKNVLFVIL